MAENEKLVIPPKFVFMRDISPSREARLTTDYLKPHFNSQRQTIQGPAWLEPHRRLLQQPSEQDLLQLTALQNQR